jgi:hypothetical protein
MLDSHVPDLDLVPVCLAVLLDVDVNGEMRVDVAHLVSVALGHANNHVVYQRPHGPQHRDVLPRPMVQFDVEDVRLGPREGHGDVSEVLGELACRRPSAIASVSGASGCADLAGPRR